MIQSDPPNIAKIKEQVFRSSKWVLLSNLASASLAPLLMIILARILTPEDFGVVGIASLVLALMTMVQQFGFGAALIQREEGAETLANAAFWLGIGLGGALYALLWAIAPIVAGFYSEPRVTGVLRWLGLNLVFSSFAVVPTALLQRDFRNEVLFWTQLFAAVIPFLVAIPMALQGSGYWALVAGALAGSGLRSILVWSQSRWIPSASFDFTHARQILGFSVFVVSEQFLGWLLVYLDKAVVGKELGTEALGIYNAAYSISLMAISLPLSALTGLALPAFSRLSHDKEAMRSAYLNGTRIVATYAIPAAFGLALFSDILTLLIFGNKWKPLGPILGIMALYSGLGNLWALSSDAFKAIGRPDIIPRLYFFAIIYMIPIFLISAPYGLLTFSICRATVVPVFAVPHILLASRHLGISKSYLWDIAWRPLVASIPMISISFCIINLLSDLPQLFLLLVASIAGCVTYTLLIIALDKDFAENLLKDLKYVRGY
jgi:PST family polysaccharide transporter